MMRPLMRLALAGVLVSAAACDPGAADSPEVAHRKAECHRLEEHIFRISPESRGRLQGLPEAEQQKAIEQLVATVPVEDIEQCAAAAPAVITCMQAAPDIAALRACVPPPKNG
jgi:hypothetical protein